jgi:hypothetical protein
VKGQFDNDDWSFTLTLEELDSNQPIIGLVFILYSRPGYNNSVDDNAVENLPDKPLVQAISMLLTNPVVPGASAQITISGDDFKFDYASSATTPVFEMPEFSTTNRYDELGEIAVNRAWFFIPLTLENTGKGLRMEIDDTMVTLGSMQYIWSD